MPPYLYQPLQPDEIRLFDLLPGKYEDPLRIRMDHVSLHPPDEEETRPQPSRLTLEQLEETLIAHPGWEVFRNVEEEYVFWNEANLSSSWDHPDPNISRDMYASVVE